MTFTCFSYCSFPLQLIFNVYKSSLSTSIQFCISILSSLSFQDIFSFAFIALFPSWTRLSDFTSLCASVSFVLNWQILCWFPLFARSIYCTLFLLDYFDYAYGCTCVYSIILIIICLSLQLPFVWGSSLVSHFWVFVLIPFNARTNHLWNLLPGQRSSPEAVQWEH